MFVVDICARDPDLRLIGGDAHGRRLKAPQGLKTRPATARVRASIFSRLAARCELDGARVLDLFAGSGSLGLEALSRGAALAVFVDSSRAATATIAHNLDQLGLAARARILPFDFRRAITELAAANECFDFIFVDSPYVRDMSAAVLALIVQTDLIARDGYVVVRQFHRAPRPQPQALECVSLATIGDHRIALYRRQATAFGSVKALHGE